MKKTLTANVSGTVFHIEEDAYETLHRYLGNIRNQFAGTDGRDEIMADIEARIAELFTERLDGRRQVVSIDDVDHVIGIMGQPEDFSEGEDQEGGAGAGGVGAGAGSDDQTRGRKRLFRDPDDQWVGGVLGGIGAYFNVDPLILRLIYLVFLFLGFGFILYVILWIVVPKAGTAADRLNMRGEEVNVENIKRVFAEGAETVTNEAREFSKRAAPRARKASSDVLNFFGEGVRLTLVAIGKFIGLALLAAGAFLAIMLIVLLFGKFNIIMSDNLAGGTTLQDIAMLMFEGHGQANWTWFAIIGLVLVPIIGLLYGGISLLFGVKAPKWFGWSLTPIWVASVIVLAITGVQLANQFHTPDTITERIEIAQPAGQVIHIASLADEHFAGGDRWNELEMIKIEGDRVILGWPTVDVRASADSLFHLVIARTARGNGPKEAGQHAAAITHKFEQQDSTLLFAPYLSFPHQHRYRAQNVRYIVEIPMGKAVHFDRGSERVIYNIQNVTDTYDPEMVGRTWTMTPSGLSPDELPARTKEALAPPAGIVEHENESDERIAATVWKGPSRRSAAPRRTPAHAETISYSGPNLLQLLRPRI